MPQPKERHKQAEIKQILNDINYMSQAIARVWFSKGAIDSGEYWTRGIPKIDAWSAGSVKLELFGLKNPSFMIKVLEKYGIKATIQNGSEVVFECSADNDIIVMISRALSMHSMRTKSRMYDELSEEVKHVSEQIPGVQSSLFSRGVKNLRNGVDTLKNIIISQNKELRK